MKFVKLLGVLLSFFVAIALMSSCKKDPVQSDSTITAQLLSANKLIIEEMIGVAGGSKIVYVRGGSSNTQSFDNEYIFFKTDNTVTYQDNGGTVRQATWNFTNSSNSKLVINFTNTPANFTVTWDNLRLVNGKFYFDEYFTDGNTKLNSHSQVIRKSNP